MSKTAFRADDALVERSSRLNTLKSKMMRETLRQYLDKLEHDDGADDTAGLDGVLSARIGELIDERLGERLPMLVGEVAAARESKRPTLSDLSVNINVDGSNGESRVDAGVDTESAPSTVRKTRDELESGDADDPDMTYGQCGESVGPNHVYCPNCGEKASHRVSRECGDGLRSDWASCPDRGRQIPAIDVLEQA